MTNYSEIWSTLNQYQFDVEPQLLIVVTCSICQKLLVDAYHGPCGCSYCKKCIEKHLEKGMKYCPGSKTNEDCKLTELDMSDNIKSDVRANKIVFSLKVQCPLDSCKHQDSLMEICNHLRVCDKRRTPCPFHEIGCTVMELHSEKISNHLLDEIHHHSMLMREWIINTKNDIATLFSQKFKDSIPKSSENLTKWSLTVKPEGNNSFQNIESNQVSSDDFQNKSNLLTNKNNEVMTILIEMKKENDERFQLLNILEETNNNLRKEIGQLHNLILNQKNEITELQNDRYKHFLKIMNLEKIVEIKLDLSGFKSAEMDSMYKNPQVFNLENTFNGAKTSSQSTLSTWTDSVMDTEIFLSNKSSTECPSATGSILWELANLFDMKRGNSTLISEYFYSTDGEQKMWLFLFPGGCSDHNSSHLCVQLIVCDNTNTNILPWPIKCKVTMTVRNKPESKLLKSMSKTCNLDPFKSEMFHFPNSTIYQAKAFQNSDIIIECIVDKI